MPLLSRLSPLACAAKLSAKMHWPAMEEAVAEYFPLFGGELFG